MKEKAAGLFLLTRQNDYQRLQETAAMAAAHQLRIPIVVHFSENEVRVQTEQIYGFVHAHPAGSVVIVEVRHDHHGRRVTAKGLPEELRFRVRLAVVEMMDDLRHGAPVIPRFAEWAVRSRILHRSGDEARWRR